MVLDQLTSPQRTEILCELWRQIINPNKPMTYDELKELPLNQVLGMLRHQVEDACRCWDPTNLRAKPNPPADPPTLACIGDFEIRARFPDHRREELDMTGAGAPPIFIAYSQLLSKYEELLYAVARVHPGETRHQTALRYIRETEGKAAMNALPAKSTTPA